MLKQHFFFNCSNLYCLMKNSCGKTQGYSKISSFDENKQTQQHTQVPKPSIPGVSIYHDNLFFFYKVARPILGPHTLWEFCTPGLPLYICYCMVIVKESDAMQLVCIFRYDIQTVDPYEDCVATMRLYLRMRNQVHRREDYPLASDPQNRNNFASWRQSELERMSPEEMLAISKSDYYCWCLDSA